MTKLEKIEQSIAELSPEELAKFRDWFDAFEADLWDRRFEEDVKAGKLDRLIEEGRWDLKAGRFRPL